MIAYFKSTHTDLWDTIENGFYIPYVVELNEIDPKKPMDGSEEQNHRFLLYSKA